MHPDARIVEYSGLVYVRPCFRGICLLDPPVGSPDLTERLEAMLEHGHYRVELRFVPVESPEEPTA